MLHWYNLTRLHIRSICKNLAKKWIGQLIGQIKIFIYLFFFFYVFSNQLIQDLHVLGLKYIFIKLLRLIISVACVLFSLLVRLCSLSSGLMLCCCPPVCLKLDWKQKQTRKINFNCQNDIYNSTALRRCPSIDSFLCYAFENNGALTSHVSCFQICQCSKPKHFNSPVKKKSCCSKFKLCTLISYLWLGIEGKKSLANILITFQQHLVQSMLHKNYAVTISGWIGRKVCNCNSGTNICSCPMFQLYYSDNLFHAHEKNDNQRLFLIDVIQPPKINSPISVLLNVFMLIFYTSE